MNSDHAIMKIRTASPGSQSRPSRRNWPGFSPTCTNNGACGTLRVWEGLRLEKRVRRLRAVAARLGAALSRERATHDDRKAERQSQENASLGHYSSFRSFDAIVQSLYCGGGGSPLRSFGSEALFCASQPPGAPHSVLR